MFVKAKHGKRLVKLDASEVRALQKAEAIVRELGNMLTDGKPAKELHDCADLLREMAKGYDAKAPRESATPLLEGLK